MENASQQPNHSFVFIIDLSSVKESDFRLFCFFGIMANEQNLVPFDSESAKLAQPKSVEARKKNKLIREALANEIWAQLDADPRKLREIARGIIDRSAESSSDLSVMADIVDGKQKDRIEADVNGFEIRIHNAG